MNYQAFNFESLRTDPRYARFTASMGGQPSWVLKWAFLAALLVILFPLLLTILSAIAMFLIVFLVLSLVNAIARLFRGGVSPGDPRESADRRNVRVIRPDGT